MRRVGESIGEESGGVGTELERNFKPERGREQGESIWLGVGGHKQNDKRTQTKTGRQWEWANSSSLRAFIMSCVLSGN